MTIEDTIGQAPTTGSPAPLPGNWPYPQVLMTFSSALHELKAGKRVARLGWNGKGMFLQLQRPGQQSFMTLPYIYMKTADNQRVPWLASQTDLLSEDWVEVPRG